MISAEEINPDFHSETFLDNLQYSINLMWINHHKDDEGEYVCSGKNRANMDYFLNQLKKWHIANLDAEINFWYDSQCTNPSAIANTKRLLDEISMDGSSPVHLRDIREIPFIQDNNDLFLPSIPIYFRVDFLKLIIPAYLMENKKVDSVVFTDFSICDKVGAALTKHELYTQDALRKLKQFGMLLGEDTAGFAENQFLQMLNTTELIESLKHAINSSSLLCVNTLNEALKHNQSSLLTYLYYAPFNATKVHVYIYFLALQTQQPIQIRADIIKTGHQSEWVNYEPEKHGYIMFGNRLHFRQLGSSYLDHMTGEKTSLQAMIKLPEGLNFSVNCNEFYDLDEVSDAVRVRNELHPGHKGASHAWIGDLPHPSQSHEFSYKPWPANGYQVDKESAELAVSGQSERNPAQSYREKVLSQTQNKPPNTSISLKK